ncbi:hypothetical protein N9E20_01720 [Crocinitomicaceae bacterium]|nr:hypothetical protein [Crocinitomicaceae bacterium]
MTLKVIEIENIKGIRSKSFALNILPNKPSILVAPNGFGKSSFGCAFNSMNNNRIVLKEEDFHEGDTANLPRIIIEYEKADGSISTLTATGSTNTISDDFDYFVIKSLIKAKGTASFYGGAASATMLIESVELMSSIPENTSFSHYSVQSFKSEFGLNGKILPNISAVLGNMKLMTILSDNFTSIIRANGTTFRGQLQTIIDEINLQTGSTGQIVKWIEEEKLETLKQITHFSNIADIIKGFDLSYNSEVLSYLAAIQVVWLYHNDADRFKKACLYSNYKYDKGKFDLILENFNTTWRNIKTSQTGGKLIVKFPKANEISNGQRDILSFLAMLFKARRKLKKDVSILIVDEVFDYLDDANLVAAQYYITKFIQEYKDKDKRIYPLILTHLNPAYFKTFAFSKQKTYYLDKSSIEVNPQMRRLLMSRDNVTIKDAVSSNIFHYNPEAIDKRNEFRTLGLPELWGEGNNYREYIEDELNKYLTNQDYDPFAVCCAVRVKIEETVYNKLGSSDHKVTFIATKKTRPKLEFAEALGVASPESYYLLGIIYNDGMHWKEGQDNISPIASKLENLTIKKTHFRYWLIRKL